MNLNRRRGVSLAEVLIAVSIVVIVAAILTPVVSSAKEAAKIAVSKSNMHQILVETLIYQSDYDGAGKYCDSFCMGLPPISQTEQIKSRSLLIPPNQFDQPGEMNGKLYPILYCDPAMDGQALTWANYAQEFRDSSVLYCDPFNNPRDLPLHAGNLIIRRLYGVNLAGTIVQIRDTGNWYERIWWANHQQKQS